MLGYRPSGLARLGLSPADLVARVPGIVIARLSAWGFDDGDADRRGFDSIVQAASGIAWKESADGRVPGALPVQALDHSAGYLLAAGAMSALRRQRSEGGTHVVATSLRQVAAHLLSSPAGRRGRGGPGPVRPDGESSECVRAAALRPAGAVVHGITRRLRASAASLGLGCREVVAALTTPLERDRSLHEDAGEGLLPPTQDRHARGQHERRDGRIVGDLDVVDRDAALRDRPASLAETCTEAGVDE